MSRIRTIKPEWREDQKLARAGLAGRVLSVAIITLADDDGRGVWREPVMAAEVFGYEPEPSRVLREALASLSGWYLEVYAVRGEMYFQILNWNRHQRVDKRTASRIPPMTDRDDGGPTEPGAPPTKPTDPPIRESLASDSREPREDVASDSAPPRDTLALRPRTVDRGPRTVDLGSSSASADEPPQRGKPRPPPAEVAEVFEHWRSTLGKSAAAKLDPKRRRRIEWALKAYDLKTVKRCIDGYATSPWHRGTDPKSTRAYDDLELWLRDAAHVEAGLEMADGGGRRARGPLAPAAIDPDEAAASYARADALFPPLPEAARG